MTIEACQMFDMLKRGQTEMSDVLPTAHNKTEMSDVLPAAHSNM
jgi:hypothetical protein